ncbi:MAG: hypothetical protein IPK03_11395 [Bacteroidetes bacterium]|nr:hypothetical protein [Bacteroidota bacterium]
MKTTILYLFIFIHLLAFSQNTVRDGFVRVDEVGKIPFIPNYPGANCINFGDYITYFFYYDTCIQTKKYKKVLDERGYNIIRSFIREENRKIFTYYPKSGKESLLYDFNLVKGDTIYIKQAFTGYGWLKCDSLSDDSIMKIVKRDTIEFLYGSMRKVIYFKPRITAEETKWVEGIGSINSIFFDPAGILALSVFPYCNLKDTQDFEGLPLNMDTFCGQEISLVNGDFKFISKPLGYYSNIPLLSYFTHENLPPFYLSPRCDTPSIVDTVQVSKCHCCQPSTYHLPRIIASKDKGNCRDTIRFTVVWDYPQAGVGYKWISDSILIIQPDSMTTIHKIQIQSVSPDTVCNRIFTLDYSTFCSPCKDSIYKSIYMPRVLNLKPRDTSIVLILINSSPILVAMWAYFKYSVQNPLKYYLGN